MEKKTISLVSFCSLFILSCSVLQISAITQGKTLHEFHKTKKNSYSAIDQINLFSYDTHLIHDYHILNQKGLKEKDLITELPGQPPKIKFNQYGGYVTVNLTAGRALYYYFTEAQGFKKDLPLLLWLNGGPGCSSIGYGAMGELGPFRINSDGKTIYTNEYAWNYAANVLFLESPAGVGFSYSNTSLDYKTRGDINTAADNLIFLLNWMERFPEYKNRDVYLSGESYAGHYVPQLAHNILEYNKRSNNSVINLKGFLIGNAVINSETDSWGTFDHYESHALISYETINEIHKLCNFSSETDPSAQCINATNYAYNETGNINLNNVYAPLCHTSNLTSTPKRVTPEFDPCTNDYVHAYLNRPDVQEAMHANVTKVSYPWVSCSDTLFDNWNWNESDYTVLPLLQEFLANGLRVWIYSGDVDGNVPVTATKYSINAMKLPVTSSWRPWYLDSEVGGYTEIYSTNLTFATVRDAGHEVPSYQPARSLSLVTNFLRGKPLPSK